MHFQYTASRSDSDRYTYRPTDAMMLLKSIYETKSEEGTETEE
jgi:hypothetical protein